MPVMADFLTNLFNSIFTPGPTPTLVVATNVSFAALQLVLLGLVVATFNVHFIVLSILSGGLWWAINWFVMELEASKQKEKDEARAKKGHEPQHRKKRSEPPEESGTETEEVQAPAESTKGGPRLKPQPDDGELRKRGSFGGDVSGTDSEWDKVSETESNEP